MSDGGEPRASDDGRFYRFARVVVMTAFRPLFRAEIVGAEQLPASGAYIVAPTHRSILDVPFTSFMTTRRIRFLAKEELLRNPIGKWLFGKLGAVPVERGTADRGALRVLEAVLRGGDPVALFPEGTRAAGPRLAPLFDGAAYLSVKLGVPIVPVGVGGSEHILPKGAKFPHFHRVAVVVGAPLYPPEVTGGSRRRAATKLTDELTTELQRCFDEAQHRAG
ncbi:MAG TPA: lysophospholipid acyltransferase family protein [Acidimicrobiia bacterium]|nr:lysophospholipid acyltransferase family protein [Acidimicrobiia bacterium]